MSNSNFLFDEEYKSIPVLGLVVPCFNEAAVIGETATTINGVMQGLISSGKISSQSKVVMVDDGSNDGTWSLMETICEEYSSFEALKLSNNRGHQIALTAGLEHAVMFSDIIVSIDADLQQDIYSLEEFIEKYKQGNDIVYGIRNDRKTDGPLKKIMSSSYYNLMTALGVDIVHNSADYRLLSKRAAEAFLMYEEGNIFVRGIIPTIGFNHDYVYFDVKKRTAGESKYTFGKMIRFAMDGITSFSIKPVRLVFMMGVFVSLIGIAMIIYTIWAYYCSNAVAGWASLNASIWFLGGCQLIGIGVIGEYIGRTYIESKKRPRYFIDKIISNNEDKTNGEN